MNIPGELEETLLCEFCILDFGTVEEIQNFMFTYVSSSVAKKEREREKKEESLETVTRKYHRERNLCEFMFLRKQWEIDARISFTSFTLGNTFVRGASNISDGSVRVCERHILKLIITRCIMYILHVYLYNCAVIVRDIISPG